MDFDFNYGEGGGLEQAQNCEALLLGRVTYEVLQAYWPKVEGKLADRLNELPKYVVSSTLTDPPWNTTVLGDDWPEEVARLRKELDGRDPRLWQPRPLGGTGRDGGGGRAAPTGLPAGARYGRSPVRRDAGQDPAAPGRIASARGRRGEHDLCTSKGGRVMRTLGLTG